MGKATQVTIDDETALRLHTMADLLDLPIERFLDRARPPRQGDVMELLRLWHRLRTDDDRVAALQFVRWMAVDSGD